MKALCLCLALFSSTLSAAPALLLAEEYRDQDIRGYVMSEKLDGVRAYWDGQTLFSRSGYPFTPPDDFLQDFPPFALDGELYSARGQFENISASVRSAHGDWQGIDLHVFDVPNENGDLHRRLAVAEQWLRDHPQARIRIIAQIPVQNRDHALQFLREIEAQGGEGVMLRDPDAPYQSGRSSRLLKLKSAHDAECTVIAHHVGKGRHEGRLGAVSCENEHGIFRIGSGFTDAQRENPPAIGRVITYRYRGFTDKGLPRFATFLRVREE